MSGWLVVLALLGQAASDAPAKTASTSAAVGPTAPHLVLVVGAAGEPAYAAAFAATLARWQAAAAAAKVTHVTIGQSPRDAASSAETSAAKTNTATTDREELQQAIQQAGGEQAGGEQTESLWLVLIGHGTFDGRTARFNLRGPDVTADELQEWLTQGQRPCIVINGASASGPFVNRLSGANRVVVTATRSGQEHNFARFGEHFSQAISDPAADLDKDEQVSVLEAFLMASARTEEFYAGAGRLATEHALLDDNGDGLGTPAAWFRGVRAIKAAKDGGEVDGRRANQIVLAKSPAQAKLSPDATRQRDELEAALEQLRREKTALDEDAYLGRLEELLLQLARLYHQQP